MSTEIPDDPEALRQRVREDWDALAAYWDERVEAGETWQRRLIQPAVARLLEVRAGERVLELACGNGEFARQMAAAGAGVLATDVSAEMLRHARARGAEIEYRQADATDKAELRSLGDHEFAAVVCNMALMDMSDLEPLAAALPGLLAPAGRFVFSTLHPALFMGDTTLVVEESMREDHIERVSSVKVSSYVTPTRSLGVAIPGQPRPQVYFHRPLFLLFEPFFRAGLVLDGLAEPVLARDQVPEGSIDEVFLEISPILVCRLRLGG